MKSVSIPLNKLEKITRRKGIAAEVSINYAPKKAMVRWMHDNATDPFRFILVKNEEGETEGCEIIGSDEDVVLFRLKFGF